MVIARSLRARWMRTLPTIKIASTIFASPHSVTADVSEPFHAERPPTLRRCRRLALKRLLIDGRSDAFPLSAARAEASQYARDFMMTRRTRTHTIRSRERSVE